MGGERDKIQEKKENMRERERKKKKAMSISKDMAREEEEVIDT